MGFSESRFIPRPVHLAHPTRPEWRKYLVGAETSLR